MTLNTVESSHVAAIGYLEAERVLLVRYTDGSLYARANFPKDMSIALSHAKSKGSFLAQPWPGKETQPVVFIGRVGGLAKGVMPNEPGQPAIHTGSDVAMPGDITSMPSSGIHNEQWTHMQDAERVPLNVIDEDADLCCRRSLAKSLKQFPAATIMSCGDCGQEFGLAMVGPNRLWRCKPAVAIVRQRR